MDLVEAMEVAGGLIRHHRIYWGWFGTALLLRSAIAKASAGVRPAATGGVAQG